jgi:hypothetical protein
MATSNEAYLSKRQQFDTSARKTELSKTDVVFNARSGISASARIRKQLQRGAQSRRKLEMIDQHGSLRRLQPNAPRRRVPS